MKKNDVLTIRIEDMGVDGEGIGKVDNIPLFVKDALIGDVVSVKIMKMKKNYGYARLLEILEPSKDRVTPPCEFHRSCGGCQIQALSYEKQLEFKQRKIRNNLKRIGGFSEEMLEQVMEPIIGMDEPYHYRNKAQFPVGRDREGRTVTGFYAGRTHTIIPNRNCLLGMPMNEKILETVLSFMEKYQIEPYDEKTNRGVVRHVLTRYGHTTKEWMVCLVINRTKLPHADALVEELVKLEGMTSISININQKNTNVILGEKVKTLWGSPYITDYIHLRTGADWQVEGEGIAYRISPQSFYQVNPVQTEKLYSTALAYAGLTGEESVWDLYCGIGTISLFLAQRAKQVYGVEIVPQAIADAKENAKLNGITNAEFFVGKAEEVLPEFYERMRRDDSGISSSVSDPEAPDMEAANVVTSGMDMPERSSGVQKAVLADAATEVQMLTPDVIVVDPPRKGCDAKCLETIVQMSPKRVVYVSCDSATLARDLKFLCENGYEVKRVRGCDMFGQTVSVETVVLLSKGAKGPVDLCSARTEVERRMADSRKVKVDFSLEDMDLSEFKGKATYEQIKAYVLEQTGLKVSSLYIAQIKKKCGLDVGENFNLPKSENARQPQCTPEKEDAIMQAFRHFGII